MPAFVYWKGHLTPRKVVEPMHVVDWMPTLCHVAGYRSGADLKWDGRNIWPILTGTADGPDDRTLYRQGVGRRSATIRSGDWKLVVHRRKNEVTRELYNLASDPSETADLAGQHPERVDALEELLVAEEARDNDTVPTAE